MYCVKCGQELSDGTKFCSKCGNAVPVNVVVQKDDSNSPNVLTATHNGVMILEKIGDFFQSTIFQVYDKHGKFEKEFLDIEPTTIDGLFIARLLRGDKAYVFLYVDTCSCTVSLGTKDVYDKIEQYDKDLFFCGNPGRKCNELVKWDNEEHSLSTIYYTKAYIYPFSKLRKGEEREEEKSYYVILRSSSDEGEDCQEGLVEYKNGKINTLLPIMCEWVGSYNGFNKRKYIASVKYGRKKYHLGKNGWLYREACLCLFSVKFLLGGVLGFFCAYAYYELSLHIDPFLLGMIFMAVSFGVNQLLDRIADRFFYAKKINVKKIVNLFDAKIREWISGDKSLDEISGEMNEFENAKLKKTKFHCFDHYLIDAIYRKEDPE